MFDCEADGCLAMAAAYCSMKEASTANCTLAKSIWGSWLNEFTLLCIIFWPFLI